MCTGLDTPGHIHSLAAAELGLSSWLSVFLGACFIALSVIALPEAVEERLEEYGALIFGAAVLVLGLYIGISLTQPNWLLSYRSTTATCSLPPRL